MRACHLRDGAAFAEFFSQLEEDLRNPDLYVMYTPAYVCMYVYVYECMHERLINEVDLDLRVTASRAALSPSGWVGTIPPY